MRIIHNVPETLVAIDDPTGPTIVVSALAMMAALVETLADQMAEDRAADEIDDDDIVSPVGEIASAVFCMTLECHGAPPIADDEALMEGLMRAGLIRKVNFVVEGGLRYPLYSVCHDAPSKLCKMLAQATLDAMAEA